MSNQRTYGMKVDLKVSEGPCTMDDCPGDWELPADAFLVITGRKEADGRYQTSGTGRDDKGDKVSPAFLWSAFAQMAEILAESPDLELWQSLAVKALRDLTHDEVCQRTSIEADASLKKVIAAVGEAFTAALAEKDAADKAKADEKPH